MPAFRRKIPIAATAFLLPNFLGFCLFTLAPVLISFAMAFTNWSLKPTVPLEFLGTRNFTDLLWVQPKGVSAPWLGPAYFTSVLLLVTAMALTAWALIQRWQGLRTAGWILAGLAASIAVTTAWQGAHHSLHIAAFFLLIIAWLSFGLDRSEQKLPVGRALVPPLLMAAAIIGLFAMHRPMWTTHEPSDARFWQYLYNTIYLMLALPVTAVGSLGLALLLNERLTVASSHRGVAVGICLGGAMVSGWTLWALGARDAALLSVVLWIIAALGMAFNIVTFRTIFYLPSFTSGVALMILWKALYNPHSGPINAVLGFLTGLPDSQLPQWLSSIELAKPALMLMSVWTGIGGTSMLLYLAALTNVSPDLLEAADIDGASRWQRFIHILWPQILPTTFFIGITSLIGGLQGGFEQARVMTNGGPAGATTTLSYYIYTLGFEDMNFGYASALSWVLFAVLFGLTALNWRFGKDLET